MLYIRHANKLYKNGDSSEFSLDPGITENGKEKAKLKFKNLLKIYGIPDKIISSPYLRTRETAQIAADIIYQETEKIISISYDSLIGEYLGNQKRKDINSCLRRETLINNPIPPERWNEYVKRISRHKRSADRREGNIWYISHGIVIQSIALFHEKKIEYPGELQGIYIKNNNVEIIE